MVEKLERNLMHCHIKPKAFQNKKQNKKEKGKENKETKWKKSLPVATVKNNKNVKIYDSVQQRQIFKQRQYGVMPRHVAGHLYAIHIISIFQFVQMVSQLKNDSLHLHTHTHKTHTCIVIQ